MKKSSLTEHRKTLPIVLILGGEENPSLPVIKSLATKQIKVAVASHEKYAIGLYSKYTSIRLCSPNPWVEEKKYIEWLLGICQKLTIEVILPLGEKATHWVVKYQNLIRPLAAIPFPDYGKYMNFRDKALTMKLASKFGVPIPKTFFPDETPIENIIDEIEFPAVIKPRISYGARGIYFPKNPEELKKQYLTASSKFGPCIIQEFIPQDGMQYKVETISTQNSEVIGAGIYEKPRFYPLSGGSSTYNRTVSRPDIIEQFKRFIENCKWVGMADADLIEDRRDGQIKLMEINPRFTRSIKLLIEAGIDYPYQLYKLSLNRTIERQFTYRKNFAMRYLLPDILWFMMSKDRFSHNYNYFHFFGKDVIYEIFSFKDLKPSLIYLISQFLKMFNKEKRTAQLMRS